QVSGPARLGFGSADPGDAAYEQAVHGGSQPGNGSTQRLGVGQAKQQVQAATRPHDPGAQDGALQSRIVSQDDRRKHAGNDQAGGRTAQPGHERSDDQTDGPQPAGKRPRDSSGGDRPAGPLLPVDLGGEHIVQGHARGVEDHRGDRQRGPSPSFAQRPSPEQPAGQAIRRGGQNIGQTDQLQERNQGRGHRVSGSTSWPASAEPG